MCPLGLGINGLDATSAIGRLPTGVRLRFIGDPGRSYNAPTAVPDVISSLTKLRAGFPPAATYSRSMSDVTQLLSAIDAGDPKAADQLLPLVSQELRKLAIVRMANEKPGQTLRPTAVDRHWAFARAWLKRTIRAGELTEGSKGNKG